MKLELWEQKGNPTVPHHIELIISLEIVNTRIILLHVHPQVVITATV